MASQTKYPSTLASSATIHADDLTPSIVKPWITPSNAAVDDGTLTTATFITEDDGFPNGQNYTHYLNATNFGFTIPDGARIDGVVVVYEMSKTTTLIGPYENTARLIIGGALKNTNKADATTPGEWTGLKTYGSSTDTWGESLTSAIVNASDFGTGARAGQASLGANVIASTASVDVISITVYYTIIPPPITISPFTDVSSTRGTGNAEITSTGGATPDKRGFVVGPLGS